MPVVERSLVETSRPPGKVILDGVDVTGHWSTFLNSRVPPPFDPGIAQWVRQQPLGATLDQCWQCGTCTAGCCLHTDFGLEEFNPRRFLYLAQVGYDQELVRVGPLLWRCLSCNKCVERCPKGVRVDEVVHEVGRYLRETGKVPESPADRFDSAYTSNVLARGILDEAALYRTYERGEGRPLPVAPTLRMGWRLLVSGRLRTGPFARRTRGWGKMRPVLLRMLEEERRNRQRAPRGPTPEEGRR